MSVGLHGFLSPFKIVRRGAVLGQVARQEEVNEAPQRQLCLGHDQQGEESLQGIA